MKKKIVAWMLPLLVGMTGPTVGADFPADLTDEPELHWANRLKIGGTIEVDASYKNDDDGDSLKVSTLALSMDARLSNWSSAHVLLLREDEDPAVTKVIDEAYITVGDPRTSSTGTYFRAGRMAVPFGNFSTKLISDPLTLELAETKETVFQIGFERNGWKGSGYMFNGDSVKGGEDSSLDQYGLNFGYAVETDSWDIDVGIGFINSMEDSDGISAALGPEGKNTIGTMVGYIPGLSAHAALTSGPYSLVVEYITALKEFDKGNNELLSGNEGAKPQAWHSELSYDFGILGRHANVAVGYQGSKEAEEVDGLPKNRFLGGLSVEVEKNTTLGLEYYHDKNYTGQTTQEHDSVDSTTVRLAISF